MSVIKRIFALSVATGIGIYAFLRFRDLQTIDTSQRIDVDEESISEGEESDLEDIEEVNSQDSRIHIDLKSEPESEEDLQVDTELGSIMHLLKISLQSNHQSHIVAALNEILFRSRSLQNQEDLLDIGALEVLLDALDNSNERITILASQIIGNLSTHEKGLKKAEVTVPKLLEVANREFLKAISSTELLSATTKTIANLSCAYEPDTESSYLNFFDAASKTDLDDGYFGNDLMKVVVNLSSNQTGRDVLVKSDILEKMEDFVVSRNGTNEAQLRCLYTTNNMMSASSWSLQSKTSDVILQYCDSLEVSPAIVEKALSIKRMMNQDD